MLECSSTALRLIEVEHTVAVAEPLHLAHAQRVQNAEQHVRQRRPGGGLQVQSACERTARATAQKNGTRL